LNLGFVVIGKAKKDSFLLLFSDGYLQYALTKSKRTKKELRLKDLRTRSLKSQN